MDASTSERLRAQPWRRATRDRRWLWLSLAAAVLLHGFFGWFVWRQMLPDGRIRAVAPAADDAIEIRFIPSLSPAAPPSQPPAPPAIAAAPPMTASVRPRPVVRPQPPAKDAMTVQLPASTPDNTPAPRLFDRNGQPLLPASAISAPAPAEPDYVQRMPTDSDKVMQHSSPITYTPTRFDRYWHKSGSTVDDALRKAVDATTVRKTIDLPGGVRIHCAVSVAMLAGGCGGDPPPPPSEKDGDERLSMPSSRHFGKDPHPPTPPTLEACIAMYRAGKPLAMGCPVDTPDRAVDAEKAQAGGSSP